jgi:very-short-patch-repair endonuclease
VRYPVKQLATKAPVPLSSPARGVGEGREGVPSVSQEIKFARAARRYPTDAERRLWSRLRGNTIGHFRRQHPVPPFVLDFACPALGVAVEADGGQHAEPREHERRDRFLAEYGWLVLRFWNNEILADMDGVIAVIQTACQHRAAARPPPHPPPRAQERGH